MAATQATTEAPATTTTATETLVAAEAENATTVGHLATSRGIVLCSRTKETKEIKAVEIPIREATGKLKSGRNRNLLQTVHMKRLSMVRLPSDAASAGWEKASGVLAARLTSLMNTGLEKNSLLKRKKMANPRQSWQ